VTLYDSVLLKDRSRFINLLCLQFDKPAASCGVKYSGCFL
jgi:hypothetical protein